MRKGCFILLICCILPMLAAAVSGSELSYKYLGPGAAPNTAKYQITLYIGYNCKFNRKNNDGGLSPTFFSFWQMGVRNKTLLLITDDVRSDSSVSLPYTPTSKCIDYREDMCYATQRFRTIVELPIVAEDIVVVNGSAPSMPTYRAGLENITYDNGNSALFTITIPGTDKVGTKFNSTPPPPYPVNHVVCASTSFFYDFSEKDPDDDKLVYEFCNVLLLAPETHMPAPPPYSERQFIGPVYSTEQQMGESVTIDRNTGMITGVADATIPGTFYILNVCISEYRNGKMINQHHRNIILTISTCNTAEAVLMKEYIKCKDYTFDFKNEFVSTLPVSYKWDFGVASSNADTSALEKPTFTFPDTGSYKIQLFIQSADGECKDTASSLVRVYPGFKPGFIAKTACASVPVSFVDTSSTQFGTINSWTWGFDDIYNTGNDTSTLQNPVYKYINRGAYKVSLVATSTVGCVDTIYKRIELLDKLLLVKSNDTAICSVDSTQLFVNSTGTATWSPAYAIDNAHSFTPKVSPDTNTLYHVHVDAGPGCTADDSVLIRSINTLHVLADRKRITVCTADTAHLSAVSDDATSYQWTGNYIVTSPDSAGIVVQPKQNAVYYIKTMIGSCEAKDTVTITVFDYPSVTAYADTTVVCTGKELRLHVRGNADLYEWTPDQGMSGPYTTDPVIRPQASTAYRVTAHDTTGCIKPVEKLVIVNTIHKIKPYAGKDTVITVGQSLQLNATGGTHYEWSPSTGLNNANIANPVALLNSDISYELRVSDDEGCVEYDSLHVRVFKTGYDILVPTAFTPNGDGLNDIFRPQPVGIKDFQGFDVFDRWGQPVFRTKTPGEGWNGRINAIQAPAGTYVWIVSGRTVDGVMIQKKGTVVLLR